MDPTADGPTFCLQVSTNKTAAWKYRMGEDGPNDYGDDFNNAAAADDRGQPA
jgi:hypothetical protein